MITLSLRLPYKLTKKRVWVGVYGGHVSVVVVFNKKPIADLNGEYCILDNHNIIAGSFELYDFNEWFGTTLVALNTDIVSVFECDLTAMWRDGIIVGLDNNADGCR